MEQILPLYSLQAEHHRRATRLLSCSPLLHLSHVSVWCSWSKFCSHWSNVRTVIWHLPFLTLGAVSLLELVLACRHTDDPISGTFLTGHFVRLQYCMVGHVAIMFGICPMTNCYICLWNMLSSHAKFQFWKVCQQDWFFKIRSHIVSSRWRCFNQLLTCTCILFLCRVFTEDGELLATVTQQAFYRPKL